MPRTLKLNIDDKLMDQFDTLCEEMGMSSETAFGIFVRKTLRKRGIPFEVSVDGEASFDDPFYSPENIAELKDCIAELENGKGVIHEVNYDD